MMRDAGRLRGQLRELLDWMEDGSLKPHVHATLSPRARARRPHDVEGRRVQGKAVVVVGAAHEASPASRSCRSWPERVRAARAPRSPVPAPAARRLPRGRARGHALRPPPAAAGDQLFAERAARLPRGAPRAAPRTAGAPQGGRRARASPRASSSWRRAASTRPSRGWPSSSSTRSSSSSPTPRTGARPSSGSATRSRPRRSTRPARVYLRRVDRGQGAWDGARDVGAPRRAAARRHRARERGVRRRGAAISRASRRRAPEEVRGEIALHTGRAQEAAGNPDGALAAYAHGAAAVALLGAGDVPARRSSTSRRAATRTARTCSARWPTRSAARRRRPSSPTRASSPCAISPASASGASRTSRAATTTRATTTTSSRATPTASPRRSTRPRRRATRRRTTRARASCSTSSRASACTTATRTRPGSSTRTSISRGASSPTRTRSSSTFLARYEPVRDAARRIARERRRRCSACSPPCARGRDAGGAEVGGASPEVDPRHRRARAARPGLRPRRCAGARCSSARRRGLRLAIGRARRHAAEPRDERRRAPGRRSSSRTTRAERAATRAAALDGRRARRSRTSRRRTRRADQIAPLRQELAELEARLASASAAARRRAARPARRGRPTCRTSSAPTSREAGELQVAHRDGAQASSATPRRRSRRTRCTGSTCASRASCGARASGASRASSGASARSRSRSRRSDSAYLPQDAVDSLDAARYLEDNEEYWPFEGDDWPDEFVGSEIEVRRARRSPLLATSVVASLVRSRRAPAPRRHPPSTARPPAASRATSSPRRSGASARDRREADGDGTRRRRRAAARAGSPAIRGPQIPEALRAQLKAQLDARIDADLAQIKELRGEAIASPDEVRRARRRARRAEMPEALVRLGELQWEIERERFVDASRRGTTRPVDQRGPAPELELPRRARSLRPRAQRLPVVRAVRPRALRRRLPRLRAGQGGRGARPLRAHPQATTRSSRFIPDAHMAKAEALFNGKYDYAGALAEYEKVLKFKANDDALRPRALQERLVLLAPRQQRRGGEALRRRLRGDRRARGQERQRRAAASSSTSSRARRSSTSSRSSPRTRRTPRRTLYASSRRSAASASPARSSARSPSSTTTRRTTSAASRRTSSSSSSSPTSRDAGDVGARRSPPGYARSRTTRSLKATYERAARAVHGRRPVVAHAGRPGERRRDDRRRSRRRCARTRLALHAQGAAGQDEPRRVRGRRRRSTTSTSRSSRASRRPTRSSTTSAEIDFFRLEQEPRRGDALHGRRARASRRARRQPSRSTTMRHDALYNALAALARVRVDGARGAQEARRPQETRGRQEVRRGARPLRAALPERPAAPGAVLPPGQATTYDYGELRLGGEDLGHAAREVPEQRAVAHDAGEQHPRLVQPREELREHRDVGAAPQDRCPSFAGAKQQERLDALIVQAVFKQGEQKAAAGDHAGGGGGVPPRGQGVPEGPARGAGVRQRRARGAEGRRRQDAEGGGAARDGPGLPRPARVARRARGSRRRRSRRWGSSARRPTSTRR